MLSTYRILKRSGKLIVPVSKPFGHHDEAYAPTYIGMVVKAINAETITDEGEYFVASSSERGPSEVYGPITVGRVGPPRLEIV